MDRETVKAMLPVIIAFAEGRTIQWRKWGYADDGEEGWVDMDPETKDFRLAYEKPECWRVKPYG